LGLENSPHQVQVIAEMPMTPTGKISKAELMQRING
jgi:non-ribosomal peptide synthetase component E (peptide arylation enzyme)